MSTETFVTPEQFTQWLRGYLAAARWALTPEQLDEIRAELAKVIVLPHYFTNPGPGSPAAPMWPSGPSQPWPVQPAPMFPGDTYKITWKGATGG